jgi:hypothetical protein
MAVIKAKGFEYLNKQSHAIDLILIEHSSLRQDDTK